MKADRSAAGTGASGLELLQQSSLNLDLESVALDGGHHQLAGETLAALLPNSTRRTGTAAEELSHR